jgi:hypothetical protein
MAIFYYLIFETPLSLQGQVPEFISPRDRAAQLNLQALGYSSVESESESELLYDWRFSANHFVLVLSPFILTAIIFLFQLNPCGYSPYVTSSLTRGLVCILQLLVVIASAVILGSESHGTHDQILLSQIPDSPNLEGQIPVFICCPKVTLRLTVSKSVSLGVDPHLGLMTKYLLLFDSYGLVIVGCPL